MAFRDIRPAADHHYLIVTKQHIKDPKQLRADDLQLCIIIFQNLPVVNLLYNKYMLFCIVNF